MMDTHDGDVDPGAGAGAVDPDRISGLPDHLLHDILIRLPSTAYAARTSILSRRWRRVWAHTPVISLDYHGFGFDASSPGGRVLDRFDAALAAHAAGAGTTTSAAVSLSRLEIALPVDLSHSHHLRTDRVAAWLHVAARSLAGELRITLPSFDRSSAAKDSGEVLLPLCESATSISLNLYGRTLRFALPPAPPAGGGGGGCAFKALATLVIRSARLRCRELEAAVSPSRCPWLKKLVMERIVLLQQDDGDGGGGDDDDGACDLSIRSDSLEWLEISNAYRLDGGRLRVHAPNLQTFHPPCIACDMCVLAPKLSEVRWRGGRHGYDSSCHHLARAGHQLRRLAVETDSSGFALMRQFNTIEELDLTVKIDQGVEEYERFMGTFGTAQAVDGYPYPCKLSLGCPCSQLENCKTECCVGFT